MSIELFAADSFELAQLADLFTAGYEGYFVPPHDEPTLAWMIDSGDLDLARSLVAVRTASLSGSDARVRAHAVPRGVVADRRGDRRSATPASRCAT